MKFKKLLATTCSFLLATTSFLCGGPASAKNLSGKNVCIFMANSGEDLGNGECDGDARDKACWDTIPMVEKLSISKDRGHRYDDSYVSAYFSAYFKYLMLNQQCPTVEAAMKYMTRSDIPDVFVVVANLAKNGDEVRADINKHFDQISECNDESLLYGGDVFNPGQIYFGKEVYLDTVPVVIYGIVPKGIKQKTSNDELVEIAEQIMLERQGKGAGDGKFKYIHNNVYVIESNMSLFCINMGDKSKRRCVDFCRDIKVIAEDESRKPILWPNYHDEELPRREAEEEQQEEKRLAEEERKKIADGDIIADLGDVL